MSDVSSGSSTEIRELVNFFREKSGPDGIVIQAQRPEEIIQQFSQDVKFFLVEGSFKRGQGELPANAEWIKQDNITSDFLRDRLYLQVGLPSRFTGSFKDLTSDMLHQAMLGIVSVPGKSGRKRHRLLKYFTAGNQTVLFGSEYGQSTIIGGRLVNINPGQATYPLRKVLAIVPQYNERDIIGGTLKHLLEQGLDVHVIDNWSTDGSYELVRALAEKSSDRITYERFPDKSSNEYDWTGILKRVTTVAFQRRHEYEWVTLNDADELRFSPWPNVTLQEAFSFLDALGYNCVDYTVFNLRPTKDGFTEGDDPLNFFKYGEFGNVSGYFVQVKSWKNGHKADLASSGGHHVLLPKLRVFPLKFLLCHYPLRSTKQAKLKIFRDRNPRFKESEKRQGSHGHYVNFNEESSYIYDKKDLVRYGDNAFYIDYLFERISGVGVERAD